MDSGASKQNYSLALDYCSNTDLDRTPVLLITLKHTEMDPN